MIDGKTPADVIAANIRLAEAALKQRLGIAPNGFRTPGGFANGLADRPDLQALLLKMGYTWVSSQYPAHAITDTSGKRPDEKVMAGIIGVQQQAQPFVYPSGLVEVPMSPISDVTAFRTGRWPLEAFLEAIRSGVTWAIEHRSVYCFLGHPSCLVVADPRFRTIETICSKVREAGDRAAFTDLGTIANQRGENGSSLDVIRFQKAAKDPGPFRHGRNGGDDRGRCGPSRYDGQCGRLAFARPASGARRRRQARHYS